jgi:hypothetical protein
MSSIYPEDGAGGAGMTPSTTSDRASPSGQTSEAREKLQGAGQAVRGEAAHFAERARTQVADQVEEKKEAVTDALGAFADAIRKAGDELGSRDQTFVAKLAGQAADGLQSLSRNLAGKSPEDMLHAARDLGRNNPTAFLAGAVLAGVAIGRFARSSAAHLDRNQGSAGSIGGAETNVPPGGPFGTEAAARPAETLGGADTSTRPPEPFRMED